MFISFDLHKCLYCGGDMKHKVDKARGQPDMMLVTCQNCGDKSTISLERYKEHISRDAHNQPAKGGGKP